ncbi:hypothetical protein PTSG_11653 [Salpingoeca rosetta]|uniref:Uncharacterized protein n=1 Tax=Salpingoeca rosetta (strain ATCC 50818 / BSB-021) TaxID=946362 RepID=F2TXQ9_SALR5|nr:uncharacterized protein PTSG_11653 [Salpingoeca rosetta]EGD76168.1 hypothetical protein PTSG_11653 [Salpingoeca rosetta]|eukprot:XP_004998343.1 hypothetical protein PTSG_11653 [Salpingoeca rosetta]
MLFISFCCCPCRLYSSFFHSLFFFFFLPFFSLEHVRWLDVMENDSIRRNAHCTCRTSNLITIYRLIPNTIRVLFLSMVWRLCFPSLLLLSPLCFISPSPSLFVPLHHFGGGCDGKRFLQTERTLHMSNVKSNHHLSPDPLLTQSVSALNLCVVVPRLICHLLSLSLSLSLTLSLFPPLTMSLPVPVFLTARSLSHTHTHTHAHVLGGFVSFGKQTNQQEHTTFPICCFSLVPMTRPNLYQLHFVVVSGHSTTLRHSSN